MTVLFLQYTVVGVAGDYGIAVASLVLAADRPDAGLVTTLPRPMVAVHALERARRTGNATLHPVQVTIFHKKFK